MRSDRFTRLALFVALSLSGFQAGAATSYVQADTTVVQSSPAESRYGWTFLTAGPGTQALLTFALSSVVPVGTVAADVKQARLVLDIPTIQVPGSLQATLLLAGFTESTAPGWATRPAAATGADSTAVFALAEPLSYHYVDVTALVRRAVTAGMATFTVAIAPAPATPGASALIWSRESLLINPAWTLSMPARLNIDLASPVTVETPVPTYFWATASRLRSCAATCPSGSVATANASGLVCRADSGSYSSTQQYGSITSSGVTYNGEMCGGQPWLAQCNCMFVR